MNPKIDITITDSHGDYERPTSDNFEPYEVYVNNERACTPTQLDELESENTKLRELVSLYHYGATHDASPSDTLAWSCKVDSLRRELGIEVDG